MSLLPEDKATRCGYFFLSVYRNPEDDPYFAFCEWDDKATSDNYPYADAISLDMHIATGLEQLRILQHQYKPGSFEYDLGNFYMTVWPKVVPMFARQKPKGDKLDKGDML